MDLPREMIVMILSYLTLIDTVIMGASNRYFHLLVSSESSLWASVQINHCPQISPNIFKKVFLPHIPKMKHLELSYVGLNVDGNLLRDMSIAVAQATKLESLDFRGIKGMADNTTYLENLTSLQTLDLSECNGSDISGVKHCINLQYLHIAFNPISAAVVVVSTTSERSGNF